MATTTALDLRLADMISLFRICNSIMATLQCSRVSKGRDCRRAGWDHVGPAPRPVKKGRCRVRRPCGHPGLGRQWSVSAISRRLREKEQQKKMVPSDLISSLAHYRHARH